MENKSNTSEITRPTKNIPYSFKGFYDQKIAFKPKNSHESHEMSLGKFLDWVGDRKITKVDGFLETITFTLDGQDYSLNCAKDHSTVVETVLKMQSQGIPFSSTWYFYEKDWRDTSDYYFFFLTYGKEIVSERMMLSTDAISKEKVLEYLTSDFDPEWDKRSHIDAVSQWFYNKFYTETTTGQILKIEEKINDKDHSVMDPDLYPKSLLGQLVRTNQLLTVLVILMGLILFKIHS